MHTSKEIVRIKKVKKHKVADRMSDILQTIINDKVLALVSSYCLGYLYI